MPKMIVMKMRMQLNPEMKNEADLELYDDIGEEYDWWTGKTSGISAESITQFLRENQNVNIEKYGNEIIGILLPDKVTLKVVECDPASKGSASSNQMKDAVLETGMTIKVPLFIESGEDIIISTDTGKYSSRA